MKKLTLPLIISLLMTTSVFGQSGTLPYLYLEDRNGNVFVIPFIDGTINVANNIVSISTPKIEYEYDYDSLRRFYFKDKYSLTLSDLFVSNGLMVPEFSSDVFSYIVVDMPYNAEEVTLIATANDPTAIIAGDGLKELVIGANPFVITVTSEDGITTLSYIITINNVEPTSISEEIKDIHVTIFPNPTTGKFTVQIPYGSSISIFDMRGQMFESRTISGNSAEFDISQYPAGVYILNITTSNQVTTKKLIKK
jgi:hypothetical protein